METALLARLLVAALIALVPHSPALACLHATSSSIEASLVNGETIHHTPAGILLGVSFLETWSGCHPNEHGNWGAPRPGPNRHLAGTPEDAARALERSFAVCGSWQGAIGRFRSGLCRPWNPVHQDYVRRAMRFIRRVYAMAGVVSPALDTVSAAR